VAGSRNVTVREKFDKEIGVLLKNITTEYVLPRMK
jgi:hypothetical protein